MGWRFSAKQVWTYSVIEWEHSQENPGTAGHGGNDTTGVALPSELVLIRCPSIALCCKRASPFET